MVHFWRRRWGEAVIRASENRPTPLAAAIPEQRKASASFRDCCGALLTAFTPINLLSPNTHLHPSVSSCWPKEFTAPSHTGPAALIGSWITSHWGRCLFIYLTPPGSELQPRPCASRGDGSDHGCKIFWGSSRGRFAEALRCTRAGRRPHYVPRSEQALINLGLITDPPTPWALFKPIVGVTALTMPASASSLSLAGRCLRAARRPAAGTAALLRQKAA